MNIDFSTLSGPERYFAMVQSIIPRPIAWVLTDNGNSSLNLAPFSFFTGICSDPPLLMFSVGKKPPGNEQGIEKDTRLNIRERTDFVVHIAATKQLDALNASAATLAHGESELDRLNLETVDFDGFSLPRVGVCDVAFGCSLYKYDEIGAVPQALIYGEIKQMYVADHLLESNDKNRLIINPEQLDPLSRLGGNTYAALGKQLKANRPT